MPSLPPKLPPFSQEDLDLAQELWHNVRTVVATTMSAWLMEQTGRRVVSGDDILKSMFFVITYLSPSIRSACPPHVATLLLANAATGMIRRNGGVVEVIFDSTFPEAQAALRSCVFANIV